MRLSVVIPCFNERATIAEVITAVENSPHADKEIIVVDDASTDGTQELLTGPLRARIHKLVIQPVNQGKGAAVRDGIAADTGDVVLIQEWDQTRYSEHEISRWFAEHVDPEADWQANKKDAAWGSIPSSTR